MAAPGKIKKLESEIGEPASNTILQMLNEYGSIPKVARILDMSDSSLFRFIEKHNIKKQVRWVKTA